MVVVVVDWVTGWGGNSVVVDWCVVVVEVTAGSEEHAPSIKAAEAQRARRMMDVFIDQGRSSYFFEVVVVVVSVVSVLVTGATGAATVRCTTTLLTTGWPFSVV